MSDLIRARTAATLGFDRPMVPSTARGFWPLVMAALGVGKSIYGAIEANQVKQRNKGYINDAYRTASARMSQQQATGSEENLESLNARGMVSGGVRPIHAAMVNGTSNATDLAGQSQANLEREYGLDRHALDAAHTQALNENKADALNAQIGAISSGIGSVASAYGSGQEMAALNAAGGSGASSAAGTAASANQSPIASAMLSGSAFEGIHPVDPLGDPTSAWHMPGSTGTTIGDGQANYGFNTGVG